MKNIGNKQTNPRDCENLSLEMALKLLLEGEEKGF